MLKRIKNSLLACIAVVFALSLTPVESVSAANPAYGTCQRVEQKVALNQGGTKNQTVVGQFCTPTTWASGPHQVDVLMHGGSYNKTYWDWPQQPELYSYVDKTLQAGRATFAYDRLGSGESSKPSGLALTIQSHAFVLHSVIQSIRAQGFPEVNVISHSFGSIIAIEMAGTYQNDASRVMLSGLLHAPGVGLGLPSVSASFYPAALDPQFSGKITDLTYLTTRPGTRGSSFYGSSADPNVIAYDEAHKDLFTTGELTSAVVGVDLLPGLNKSSFITAPTLVVMGEQDGLFCGLLVNCSSSSNIRANEAPYYASAKSLDAIAVLNTGHNVALHPSANTSFSAINEWMTTH